MKKRLLLLSVLSLAFANGYSQEDSEDQNEKVQSSPTNSYNRWAVDLNVGQSKGIRPYAEGAYGSNPRKQFGSIAANHYSAGIRYMVGPRFGLKVDFAYDRFESFDGSGSTPFDMQQYRMGIQGVVNAVRLFTMEDKAGRFGLLLHAGGQVAQRTPQMGENEGRTEYDGGLIYGVTPQLRLTNRLGLQADLTILSNVRQHLNWDGSYSSDSNNLLGSMYTFSLGMNYSFGSQPIHGDWAIIEDSRMAEIEELDRRIGEIETMMNDSDKDGVPDYLDVEPNSIAGVAVDSKGRMVDLNRNGIPDELEKYVDTKVTETVRTSTAGGSGDGTLKQLINEGYIAVFFDFGSDRPTNSSTENIAFILNYLRNNPSASADITGYADEIGNPENNKALSGRRAENVRATLIKAGISESRLNIVPAGEDTSVDKSSASARSLVRKVIFRIK